MPTDGATAVQVADWAYLAALIDGEGHVALVPNNMKTYPSLQPRVVVAMSTKQPVKWVYVTFKVGTYTKRPSSRNRSGYSYRWGVYSKVETYYILQGCLPYLKLKRKKAKEVMSGCRYQMRS
jgi:hypothetical protein